MPSAIRRRSPEELLQQIQAEEDYERRAFKVFLGTLGVGKSFRMLDEARVRTPGLCRPHTAQDVARDANGAEQAGSDPAAEVSASSSWTRSDLKRHPRFAWWTAWLMTTRGSAHAALGGRERASGRGISVLTSVIFNTSTNARRVQRITGKHVTQTVRAAF